MSFKITLLVFGLTVGGLTGQRGSADVMVITGGRGVDHTAVDTVQDVYIPSGSAVNWCPTLPPLDAPRIYHVSFMLEEDLLICGGTEDNCKRLDLVSASWVHHSDLTGEGRELSAYAAGCIFGGHYGYSSYYTIECWSGTKWEEQPDVIPGDGFYQGCAVPLPSGDIIIAGGTLGTKVLKRKNGGIWESLTELPRGSANGGCALINGGQDLIVIAGWSSGENTLSSFIMDLSTNVFRDSGNIKSASGGFGTGYVANRLTIFGGRERPDKIGDGDIVQEYDEETGEWSEVTNYALKGPIDQSAVASVPGATLGCQYNETFTENSFIDVIFF